MQVRIIVTDDHPVVTEGIKTVLKTEEKFELIAEFTNGHQLLQSPLLNSADILLLDLNMPRVDGLQILQQLHNFNLKKIVISAYKSQKLVDECRATGASAYILKTENLSSLKETIAMVMDGKESFPDFGLQNEDADNQFSYLDAFLIKYKLTKREVEIIRMMCDRLTSQDIADRLSLSLFTVQTHRKNIYRKLSLDHSNLMGLYEFAAQNSLIIKKENRN